MIYKVKDVVCDYGVYEDDRLILILNNRANALMIAKILEADRNKKGAKEPTEESEE